MNHRHTWQASPAPLARGARRSLLAGAALLALGGPALAEDEEGPDIKTLTKPESTISVGGGYLSDDNRRFGQYSGLRKKGGYLLLDADILWRDDATGAWTRVFGRNVGLDSRELRGEYELQGNWSAFIDYNQIPRYDPLTINTGLAGIGTATQTLNGTALRDVMLDTRRDRTTLGFGKQLPAGFDFQVRYISEDKNGSRVFGRGTADFLADPIDYRSEQLEAILGYTSDKLQLQAGYYGTAFKNKNSVLDVNTGVDIALAPDNESHQIFLGGGYSFSPTTRANFKAAYTRGKQNETFYTTATRPSVTNTNLGGEVDTTLIQAGISSRPSSQLSLLANLRYEDRDDKTPLYQYIDASSSRDGFNTPFSRTTTQAKAEASYLLPIDLRLTGGVDYERRKRSVLAIRQASWRAENDETTLRFEVRRSLSETLNGSLALHWADRDGSDFLDANNNTAADLVDPIHFADRKREKLRLTLDWVPIETLSLQLIVDAARDKYHTRNLGPEDGRAQYISLDGNYQLNENWQLLGWISNDDSKLNQTTRSNSANGTLVPVQNWEARMRNKGEAYGLGLRGKIGSAFDLGADLQYAKDTNVYQLNAVMPPEALLPDIGTKHTTARLFGQYAVKKNLSVRMDLGYDRFNTNDWTWAGWRFTDGTTVVNPNTSSTFFGLSLVYRMW
ncbi:MtrB/PioB family decaheme-associated outer membrane protein [Roseateles violae]|uniref:MtrB/PioB family decaheme-associated outer membrane protein n=1 Tax=Roseateles violae TaxID=3058042 RepID=A0ABT8DWN9_9BURK|nr:MtrB/PioB family decaheme-associated outer membrane protein [Pelomonas sp. PFR6]MDN3922443.1 MtrB/PioB family decaheme-associated outer membrane protein [Pelomonas sp. PFR6]